ncbi:hypothetical protein ACT26D_06425 [Megasphaera elsdenii]|uniref:hypothetical protein n=1 Tax=Megasphaera elsdenii TaxID=907 RepID=UPI004036A56A
MSMHNYPVYGYGLFLNKDEADAFIRTCLKDQFGDKEDEKEDYGADFWNMDNREGMFYVTVTDDEYDTAFVSHLFVESDMDGDDFVEGLFLDSGKTGTIVPELKNDMYKNKEEFFDYFKNWIGDCLPEGFDYEAHAVLFQAVQSW